MTWHHLDSHTNAKEKSTKSTKTTARTSTILSDSYGNFGQNSSSSPSPTTPAGNKFSSPLQGLEEKHPTGSSPTSSESIRSNRYTRLAVGSTTPDTKNSSSSRQP